MHYEVVESRDYRGHWHAEAIDSDGRVFVAVFSGPNAKERAHDLLSSEEWLAGSFAGEKGLLAAFAAQVRAEATAEREKPKEKK